MRKFIAAALLLLPFAAFADDPAPPPAPPATPAPAPAPAAADCPHGMVCLPMNFVQQAVLQLGLRDQIGGGLATALQQSQEAAQRHVEPAAKP